MFYSQFWRVWTSAFGDRIWITRTGENLSKAKYSENCQAAIPARPPQGAYARSRRCAYSIKSACVAAHSTYVRTHTLGNSALYRHTVIYPAEMKKESRSQNLTWEFAPSAVVVRGEHLLSTTFVDA